MDGDGGGGDGEIGLLKCCWRAAIDKVKAAVSEERNFKRLVGLVLRFDKQRARARSRAHSSVALALTQSRSRAPMRQSIDLVELLLPSPPPPPLPSACCLSARVCKRVACYLVRVVTRNKLQQFGHQSGGQWHCVRCAIVFALLRASSSSNFLVDRKTDTVQRQQQQRQQQQQL